MNFLNYEFTVDEESNIFDIRLNDIMVACVDASSASLVRHGLDSSRFFISSDPISILISSDQAHYLSNRFEFEFDEIFDS